MLLDLLAANPGKKNCYEGDGAKMLLTGSPLCEMIAGKEIACDFPAARVGLSPGAAPVALLVQFYLIGKELCVVRNVTISPLIRWKYVAAAKKISPSFQKIFQE